MKDDDYQVDDTTKDLMNEVGKEILKLVKEHANDDESSLSVSAMLLKFSLGIMRGSLTDEETIQTLLYSIRTLESNHPILPNDRKIN